MKLLPGGEFGVLAFAAPAERLILGRPTFITHYCVLRTWGTTCDTYKWLAFTVCLRRSCFWARPDGLWSTLTRCSMTIAQGPCLLFIWITRGGKCGITQSASRNIQNVWMCAVNMPALDPSCSSRPRALSGFTQETIDLNQKNTS